MTENFQPSEDIFDDVEGHMPFRKVEAEETDDVEGHMPRIRTGVEAEATDDVEGHAKVARLAPDDIEKGWKRPE